MQTNGVAVPGLGYLPGYLAVDAQAALLEQIDRQPWLTDLRRRVQHYGYRYDYTLRTVDESLYLGPLPFWSQTLAERLLREGWTPRPLDQLIVNEYLPGQGIGSHVDCVPCFDDTIISVSLGSPCVMHLSHTSHTERVSLLLEPGSLLAMAGEARYEWKHGIPPRKSDTVDGRSLARGRRVSLTFRSVLKGGAF